jgi:proteasome lid subunit RPN8/RPN11
MTQDNTKGNNQPAVEGLDFHGDYTVNQTKRKPFPGRSVIEPRVMIDPDVYAEIKKHAEETVAVEQCGVLVGNTCQDDVGKYLVINGSIRGKHARNEGAQVVFTHETWDYIHSQMEANFKGRAIVGWYHTHPGFGIFLSDMDKFIQDYFFNQPFQVALVIDPTSAKEGLFAWINGKTTALSRCWIGDEMRKLTQGPVGTEKNFEKMPMVEPAPQHYSSDSPAYVKIEKADLQASGRPPLLMIALAFFIGVSLSLFTLRSTFYHAALTAARAETRELLGAWAADTAAAEEFKLLHGKIAAFSKKYEALPSTAEEYAAISASFTADLNDFVARMSEIATATANRRNRVQNALESVSSQPVRTLEQSEQVVNRLREAMAESILIQIMPYLASLSAQPLDMNRIREAQPLVKHIIQLDPRLEPGLREKLPWLFF